MDSRIRLKGQGVPGDAAARRRCVHHDRDAPAPHFERDGRDLRLDLPITLKEAVLGGKVPVPTLTGPSH
jgi:DnaJ-class molecular chaperone